MNDLRRLRRMAFVGRKGGVGKTATTVTAADDLAYRHTQTVLVIDMDPQANATAWLGVRDPERTMSDALYHAHVDGALDSVIVGTRWDNVWCAPAEEALASREADRDHASPDFRLRRLLRTADLSWVDTVLVDAPPSLGPLLRNTLNAITQAYIVTDAERGGLDGVARMFATMEVLAEDSNPDLAIGGLVMNRVDARAGEHDARWGELGQVYAGYRRYKMPLRVAVGSAFGASAPPRLYGNGGAAFTYAARELVDDWMKEDHA